MNKKSFFEQLTKSLCVIQFISKSYIHTYTFGNQQTNNQVHIHTRIVLSKSEENSGRENQMINEL